MATLPFSLFLLQSTIFMFSIPKLSTISSILYKYFPVEKRFTYMALAFGCANPVSKVLTAFSLIPLTEFFWLLWSLVFDCAGIDQLFLGDIISKKTGDRKWKVP
ncbi:hypothetical protein [Candidatus Bandiella euplotis]|uniref:hypothetical protein n=1 Tax=Candidatus Bandiella euplotis TaxID=1664265 RepID=UPI002B26099B|nr:hypothetical protein [Candidatus Bandiella woodruffii]